MRRKLLLHDARNGFAIMLEVLSHIIFGMEHKGTEIALQMDFNV